MAAEERLVPDFLKAAPEPDPIPVVEPAAVQLPLPAVAEQPRAFEPEPPRAYEAPRPAPVAAPAPDPQRELESSGLVMIETDPSKSAVPASMEPETPLGRPRRERPVAPSESEAELVQIETRK